MLWQRAELLRSPIWRPVWRPRFPSPTYPNSALLARGFCLPSSPPVLSGFRNLPISGGNREDVGLPSLPFPSLWDPGSRASKCCCQGLQDGQKLCFLLRSPCPGIDPASCPLPSEQMARGNTRSRRQFPFPRIGSPSLRFLGSFGSLNAFPTLSCCGSCGLHVVPDFPRYRIPDPGSRRHHRLLRTSPAELEAETPSYHLLKHPCFLSRGLRDSAAPGFGPHHLCGGLLEEFVSFSDFQLPKCYHPPFFPGCSVPEKLCL